MADTIGRQLKKAREARNLSIEKVTQATLLRARHIEALEADDFESLPSPVQARAFLRIYAEFLGLSVDELIANQKASAGQPGEEIPVPPEIQAPVVEMKAPEPEPAQVEEEILPETAEEGKIPLRERARNWLAGVLDRLRTRFKPAEFDELDEAGLVPEPVEAAIPEEPSEPDRQVGSQEIFTSIGEILRDRRESLSLTLDEIERHTHVRKHYLQALEEGQFERLPSSVQTRGMLNNYAHFMDMDVDAILLKYADGLQAQLQERQPRPA
ncbi:MAG TPA: helix-turn-helix domain-containing protein, partial [Anaerolineales bacterium]|nr:helix-turn-helix domain-containing protein [Anaerolineales bacterium]